MCKETLRLIWAVKGPIIVPRKTGWPPPEVLQELVPQSRIEETLLPEKETASDVEALIYIHCASMEAPLDSDWVEIMEYLLTKVMKKYRNIEAPVKLQSRDELPEHLARRLEDLKQWLYQKSMAHVRKILKEMRKGKKPSVAEPDLFVDSLLAKMLTKC